MGGRSNISHSSQINKDVNSKNPPVLHAVLPSSGAWAAQLAQLQHGTTAACARGEGVGRCGGLAPQLLFQGCKVHMPKKYGGQVFLQVF